MKPVLKFFTLFLTPSCLLLASITILSNNIPPKKTYSLSGFAQGTTYSIKYIQTDSIISSLEIDSILKEIDHSLSLYIPTSIISRFNVSNHGVKMDQHLKNVVEKSIEISALSKGYFDITCKPLSDLWGLGSKTINTPPTTSEINSVLYFVGSKNLYIVNDSLLKTKTQVQIDCNGIAQGYTVDVLYEFLKQKNIDDFIIELGGEIRTAGKTEKNIPWMIGIENPSEGYGDNFLIDKKVTLSNYAITTSGSYRKYIKLGSTYFTHIIDPIKGMPITSGIISVTVIAPTAIQADALDNAFMLLGIPSSFELLNRLPEIGLHIIFKDSTGQLKDTSNLVFKKYLNVVN